MSGKTTQSFFDASSEFFKDLIDSKNDEKFVNAVKMRVDKIAREICLATDENVTNILKGQLSICYELIDGTAQANESRLDQAKSGRDELSLEATVEEF